MSRDDLLRTNADIVGKVCDEIVSRSPNSILIIVSNPLDAMLRLHHLFLSPLKLVAEMVGRSDVSSAILALLVIHASGRAANDGVPINVSAATAMTTDARICAAPIGEVVMTSNAVH